MRSTPELLAPDEVRMVREAYRDWRQAQCFFEEVTDPCLVDFAIYWERAARLRYRYLLSLLKGEGFALSQKELIRLVVY
ncbi:MAG: hypothetical protein PWQ41_2069 [Bacillota bacterium]|nr:hypothetical protein [Bacillota bacterium]MDK2926295.1 hypothetical protein [Bacillota bacterium]MDK2960338.1 hypothetical protein [Bacillota bacterium]